MPAWSYSGVALAISALCAAKVGMGFWWRASRARICGSSLVASTAGSRSSRKLLYLKPWLRMFYVLCSMHGHAQRAPPRPRAQLRPSVYVVGPRAQRLDRSLKFDRAAAVPGPFALSPGPQGRPRARQPLGYRRQICGHGARRPRCTCTCMCEVLVPLRAGAGPE